MRPANLPKCVYVHVNHSWSSLIYTGIEYKFIYESLQITFPNSVLVRGWKWDIYNIQYIGFWVTDRMIFLIRKKQEKNIFKAPWGVFDNCMCILWFLHAGRRERWIDFYFRTVWNTSMLMCTLAVCENSAWITNWVLFRCGFLWFKIAWTCKLANESRNNMRAEQWGLVRTHHGSTALRLPPNIDYDSLEQSIVY